MSKILFLTTAHNYNDDRIFYHQAKELKAQGYEVKISSLYSDYQGEIDEIEIESYAILNKSSREKILVFQKNCESYKPDCIICSEPLAVIAARKFSKIKKVSIIYDITEWYPSMTMLDNYNFFLKFLHGIKFFLIQLYAGFLSNYFIFGETTKKFPLAYVFPFKNKMILPYYPDERFVSQNIKTLEKNQITLCYTGAISEDKGIGNFFKAVDKLQKRNLNLRIKLLIIGSARQESDEMYYENLLSQFSFSDIEKRKPTTFENFTHSFSDADVCFDLREFNFENHHSLPIKLFYYMGAGKPVIYSDLKAIRKHLDVSEFGFLVNPQNSDMISECIEKYVKNHQLYNQHANNAAKEFQQKYNWNVIKYSFIDFIKQSLPKNTQ